MSKRPKRMTVDEAKAALLAGRRNSEVRKLAEAEFTKFDRAVYQREYMREYMRKRRAKKNDPTKPTKRGSLAHDPSAV